MGTPAGTPRFEKGGVARRMGRAHKLGKLNTRSEGQSDSITALGGAACAFWTVQRTCTWTRPTRSASGGGSRQVRHQRDNLCASGQNVCVAKSVPVCTSRVVHGNKGEGRTWNARMCGWCAAFALVAGMLLRCYGGKPHERLESCNHRCTRCVCVQASR